MAEVRASIQVTCTVRRDEQTESFVSHCPELKLYSAGNTELEALEAIRSAVVLFLEWAYDQRKLGTILQDLGMKFTPEPESTVPWAVASVGPGETQSIPIQVPFYLLQQAQALGA